MAEPENNICVTPNRSECTTECKIEHKTEEKENLESLLEDEIKIASKSDMDRMIEELERITYELALAIEEKRLNEYFDKQYRIYLVEQMSISPMFASKIEQIIELVKEDAIEIITDNDADSDLPKLFMPEEESQFIISMDSKTFINSIIETYSDDKAIVNQFLCDFFRQKVAVNDTVYEDIDELLLKLSESNRKTTIQNKEGKIMSSMIFLLLVTCQSSHFLSYLYSHNAVSEVRDAAILTSEYLSQEKEKELKSNDKLKPVEIKPIAAFEDPKANYYVMSAENFNLTNIIIDSVDLKPEIGCIIESTYKIFDTQNIKKVYDIKAETIFNETSNRCLIKYTVKKSKSD